MSFNYRPDIDGLRAIAVIPVILFHADFSLFSGGYVGVDIFFVISGYLITSILLRDIEHNKFSILTFYERRIRRIFPALFTVLIASTCVALLVLFPTELKAYGKSLIAATLFYSNYHFMFDSGYFTSPAETRPLLHMWSLAVEEQFYIIFPIYLYLVSRFKKSNLGAITVVMLILSLLFSILSVYLWPNDAFYSTPGRAWELLAGSLLAIYPRKQPLNDNIANLLSIIGLGLIVYSILFFTKDTPFPGATALLPVVGTTLIIYTGTANKNMVGSFLSTKAFRFPGLISYSLYLWHWPVLVFYKIYAIGPVSELEIAVLIGVTFVLSYLSWRYVETPFRKRQLFAKRNNIIFAGSSVALVSTICGVIIVIGNGFPGLYPNQINNILTTAKDFPAINKCKNINSKNGHELRICSIGSNNIDTVSFAVWGDSHGKSLYPGIDLSAKNANNKGIFVAKGGCLPLIGVHQVRQGYETCIDIANAFIEYLSEHPEITQVIIVSRWAIYAMGSRFKNEKGRDVYIIDNQTEAQSFKENKRVFSRSFERTLKKLSSLDREVIIVTQVPETEWNIPVDMARSKIQHRNIEFRPKFSDYLERQSFVTQVIDRYGESYNIRLVHPYEKMCNGKFCEILDEDIPIYRDSNHVTKSYAEKLAVLFDPIFVTFKLTQSNQ